MTTVQISIFDLRPQYEGTGGRVLVEVETIEVHAVDPMKEGQKVARRILDRVGFDAEAEVEIVDNDN